MKVIQVGETLTNQEVLGLVQEEVAGLKKRSDIHIRNPDDSLEDTEALDRMLTSATRVTEYLSRCYPAARRAQDSLTGLMRDIEHLPLTLKEVLQIMNLAPYDAVITRGVCKYSWSRFSETEIENICTAVRRHFYGEHCDGASDPAPIADADCALAPTAAITSASAAEGTLIAVAATATKEGSQSGLPGAQGRDPADAAEHKDGNANRDDDGGEESASVDSALASATRTTLQDDDAKGTRVASGKGTGRGRGRGRNGGCGPKRDANEGAMLVGEASRGDGGNKRQRH